MGKGKGESQLGRALLKGTKKEAMRKRAAYKKREAYMTTLSALGIDDGNKMTSVTESNSLDDFISSAVLANRQFEAVRDVNVVMSNTGVDVQFTSLDDDEDENTLVEIPKLPVPRRPAWDATTTPEELDKAERLAFLEWRRGIAKLEEEHKRLKSSPFEKNLEFWRQLWRVVERSDVLTQVVDARNPLLFRCEDLERYVSETDRFKRRILMLNKADYLTEKQRMAWSEYLSSKRVNHIFFSAVQEQEILDQVARGETRILQSNSSKLAVAEGATAYGSPRIFSRQELIDHLSMLAKQARRERVAAAKTEEEQKLAAWKNRFGATVGFSGYPNVGKSSVINVLKGVSVFAHDTQRVSVAATPGHTKHFQTMKLTDDVTLCDSPGLVFPSFFSSKSEMLCNGILPIDEIRGRDFVPAIDYVCDRIPRREIEKVYNIRLKILPSITKARCDPLLEAFCVSRGLLGKSGRLDEARGARLLLKDFVKGKLLHGVPPPTVSLEESFQQALQVSYDGSAATEGMETTNNATTPLESVALAPKAAPVSVMDLDEVDEDDLLHIEGRQELHEDTVVTSEQAPFLDNDVMGAATEFEAVEFAESQGDLDIHDPSRRLKRHGRKHKKGRDKDPYGKKGLGLGNEGVVHMKNPFRGGKPAK